MKRNKICILPKLYNCGGDITRQWFIFYSFRNPETKRMIRFRVYDGFTECRTKKAKYEHGEKMVKKYTEMLIGGWNPFTDGSNAIYEDNLTFETVTTKYKNLRSNNKTFNYYYNLYLPEVNGLSEKTYRNYVSKFRIFDAWLQKNNIADNDLRAIDHDIIVKFFLYLINEIRLSKITISKYSQILSRFFGWAVKNKHLKSSPVFELPVTSRVKDMAPRPINDYDIERIACKIKETDPQLWLAVQLEYYCLLRPGSEIRLAKVKWFDLARGTISVPNELIKTKKNKIVIIPNQFREFLLNDLKLHNYPLDFYVIGTNGIPGINHVGANNLRNRFNKIRDELNLPKEYKLYSFKHTGNSRLVDTSIPFYHIQRQNGHTSIRSTEQYIKNKIGFKSTELQNNFPSMEFKV